MLYRTLLKLKERNGLTDDLKNKIDIFFATGRITEEQYNDWAKTEHVILLRGQLGETALSYKYQTKSDRMIVLV